MFQQRGAGVTSGAFYSNVSSKEALLKEVITACVDEPFIDVENGSFADRRESFKQWLAMYISSYHRENPALGCVMPTLSADVARSKPEIRDVLERLLAHVLEGEVEGTRRILLNAHHGRIVKTTGDGLLVEFASVIDGVRCASELQRAMAESNAPLRPNPRIEFRVGINVGDIAVEDGAIFGERLYDPVRPSWPTGGPPTSRPDR